MMIQNPIEARGLLNRYVLEERESLHSALAEGILQNLLETSSVACLCRTVELVFAAGENAPEALRIVTAEIAEFCADNGFWSLAEDGRGYKIAALLKGEFKPKMGAAPVPEEPLASLFEVVEVTLDSNVEEKPQSES